MSTELLSKLLDATQTRSTKVPFHLNDLSESYLLACSMCIRCQQEIFLLALCSNNSNSYLPCISSTLFLLVLCFQILFGTFKKGKRGFENKYVRDE